MRERYTRHPRPILWLVPGGEVTVGGSEPDSRPSFQATVEPFYLSKAPVTNEQYEAFDRGFRRSPLAPGDRDPALGVSYHEAHGYCAWYASVSRKPIRLPTEVEWEYACRAGTTTRCFWGDDPAGAEGKRPNPFGLLGMLGTAWEWTGTRFLPYPPREGDGRDDPEAPGDRVLRGGSFRSDPETPSCSLRRAEPPDARPHDAGFRIARSFRSVPG